MSPIQWWRDESPIGDRKDIRTIRLQEQPIIIDKEHLGDPLLPGRKHPAGSTSVLHRAGETGKGTDGLDRTGHRRLDSRAIDRIHLQNAMAPSRDRQAMNRVDSEMGTDLSFEGFAFRAREQHTCARSLEAIEMLFQPKGLQTVGSERLEGVPSHGETGIVPRNTRSLHSIDPDPTCHS